MTHRPEKEGEARKIPLDLAISNIFAQEHLDLFSVPKERNLGSELALVEDIGSVDDSTLERLKKTVHGMSVLVQNAASALRDGRSAFGVDEKHPDDPLWGTEEAVMRRTKALVAQAESVRAVKERVLAEVQKRAERARALEEEAGLAPLRKPFESLPREQVLEQLVELLDQLLEAQEECHKLDREMEYGSHDPHTLSARSEANLHLRLGLEEKIKAARQVIAAKKSV